MTIRLRTRALGGLMASLLVVLAACGGGSTSGGGGGASGGDGAPAPSGAVASKMVPQMNGWSFPNFPSATFADINFDTADLVSMFGSGPDVCVDGVAEPCTLTAEAAAWARMVNQARATGHCEGLVALASARFNAAQLPETVKLPSEQDEVHAIMRSFATQFVPEVQKAIEDWTKASLADKVDELKKSFGKDKLEYTLGVYTEGGGHAILPYAVEYPTPDVARIMVYDSNWPGRNRYVDVDLKTEKWTFSFAGDDPANDPNAWTGGAQDMDLTPFEAREGTCPFCSDGTKLDSTTLLVRTDDLNWSVETEDGAVSPTSPASGDGAAARPVKGGVVITRLAPRVSDRSSYDYVITIPNKLLQDDTASTTTMGPTTVAPSSTAVKKKRRARLRFPGASSVFAVMKTGVAQFTTPGGTSDSDAVEIGTSSIKSSNPKVDLTLASGNLVANASGSSVELGSTENGELAVAVTTATGEVIQQQVTADTPAVQVKADESGAVTVLEASSTGEVQKTEVAADGTKTQTTVDASALNLNKVEVELPPALASKAIESLPKMEDRNLNNPNYKADEAYVAPTTVPSAAGAKESATGATTTVPSKSETATTLQTKNAALPATTEKGETPTTLQTKNAALPTTTAPKSVSAAGVTPTTIAAVVKPTLTNFRITAKTFGDDAFTVEPPDSNSPGGFRYTSSKTDVATVSLTTGRVTIVGAGSTVITATQSAAKGYEAATISTTFIVGKATPTNVALKDVAKTFGDDSFVIAKPTSDSPGVFTFTSSDETVVKQSKTTGRWFVMGAGKATITATQAATDDFVSATDSLLVTVKKGTPEVTAPADVAKTYLDADFDLPKPTSDSRGAFTFTSSDANVVTVTSTGRATIKGGGSATITVSQASTDDWFAASTSYKVTVGLAAPTLSAFDDVSKTFGDDAFSLTAPKSNSSGAVTYKSSDEKVATVGISDGRVTIIGAGSATITASQAATSSFAAGSISSKLTVAKATPKLSDLLVLDKSYGDPDFTLKPTSNSAGKVTYSTDKPAVFTVDAATGLVKIVGVGTATLTAKQESTANYEAASVSASVTVKKGTPTITWTLDNKTFGDAAFDLTTPTSPSTGAFTYAISSSDQSKATVSSGRVTILNAGTVTVTASQAATDFYNAATKTATLTIDKAAPTLSGFAIPTKTYGDAQFTLTPPTSPSTGSITYESMDPTSTVATVTVDGQVTITGAGTLQIKAKQAFTANYTVASALATLTVNRAVQSAGVSNGLVAKWSFDSANTLGTNSAGTGDLAQTGGPTWTASGKVGGAVSLNGSGAYLYLPTGTITGLPVGNSNYTISAWIKPTAFGQRGIVGWGNYGAGNQNNAFRLHSDGGLHNYWWGNDLITSPQPNTITTSGTWAHVVATYDGTTRRIWVNGVSVAFDSRGPVNVTCATSGCSFAVGKTVGNEWFAGLLDEVAIYNRALSSNEITQLAAGGGSGISVTSTSGNFGTPLTLTTSGGQGTGSVSFSLVAAGTAGCTLSNAILTATSGGTCTVKATKAGDTNYEPSVSTDTVVTFNRIAQASAVTISTTTATAGVNLSLVAAGGTGTGTYSFAVVTAGSAVCSIQNGSLVTTSSGTCTITATKAADDNYTAATSATTTITVGKQTPTIAPFTLVDRYYLGAGFTVTAPGSTSNGTWTWASSNTSVASINSSTGAVTLGVPGTTIITATQATTAMYNSAAVTAELRVLPATPTYGAFTIASKIYGDAPFTFTAPTSNSPATIAYTSSDPTVATVNSSTRTITVVGTGTTTITASQVAQGNFAAGSTAASLTVSGAVPTMTAFGTDSGSGAGLKGTRYVGYFNDNVNWFATATKHGETNQITNFTNFTSSADNYSWEWTGSFKASTTGTYTFCTNSDDASYLWLGVYAKVGFTQGNSLVDNRGAHGMTERCNTTTLVGGTYYPIRIQFGEAGGGDAIIVRFIPPGGSSIYNGTGYYFGGMGITKTEGDAAFTPTLPTSNSPAPITYSSSDTSVASINATTGEVTVVARGTATLTASQPATGNWGAASTSVDVRVLRRATVGTFTIPAKTFASPAFAPVPPTSDSPGAWSYESSNTAVAWWDSATGLISVAAAGTATVTAVQAETGEFAESRVSTTITIAGETLVSIESGERNVCGVTGSGGVACWGQNNYGQLGDGTTTNRAYPVGVSGLTTTASKVAVGLWHACAVMTNGTVKCWGRNDWGQLGNNTNTISYTAVSVSGITNAVDIAVSGYASCAILSTGGVSCWGYGGYGHLANGTTSGSYVPVAVPSLTSGVTSIDATELFFCVTTDKGAAKCWGRNDWTNLGDGTTTQRNVPVDVLGLTDGAVRIAVMTHSACVVTGSGGVKCWGYGGNGQNGNGTSNQYAIPVAVTGITNAIDIDGGHQHVCARLSTGAAKCWGWNGYNQLGNGSTANAATPIDVTGLSTGVRAIAAGYYSTCALTAQGAAWCWGYNGDSQLGDKTTTQRSTPVGVAGVKTPIITDPETQLAPAVLPATKFRLGDNPFTFAAVTTNRPDDVTYSSTDTSVFTVDGSTRTVTIVGKGTAFLKASVPASATQSAHTSFARVYVPDTEYVQVRVNNYSTCGLTRAGGVKCWGNSDQGQLGNGTTDRRYTPTDVQSMTSGIADVTLGRQHTCAITTFGGVRCWGYNGYGQLGNNSTGNQYTPVPVVGLSAGVIKVEAGYAHTCALLATGGVKCWGLNNWGQLGDGSTDNRYTPIDVVGLGSGVVDINLMYEGSCALLDTGAVKCWGNNGQGQLGDGTTTNRTTPRAVTGLSSGVKAIAGGDEHACALLTSGAVKCWGYNGYGQLGDGSTSVRYTPVAVSGLTSGVARLEAGGYHNCVIMTTGGVKCWGRNDEGELGDGTTSRRYTPIDVPGLSSGVSDLSASNSLSTCAIVEGDSVKCWGFNDSGQTGTLVGGNVLSPTDVIGAFAGTARTSTVLGALALPGTGYTTSSAPFTLTTPTSTRTVGAVSCANGGVCQIGDVGPGGGRVFYVSSGFAEPGAACSPNCTYLEAAPPTWSGSTLDPYAQWSGNTGTLIGASAQGTAIGTGFANTAAIVAQSAISNKAATMSRAYSGGGFTDWFLPSTEELRQLSFARDSMTLLRCDWYTSSTEYNATSYYLQQGCNDSSAIVPKSDNRYFKPVRAFSVTNTAEPLNYFSSNTSVATVNKWTGDVTIVGAGSTVLAAMHGGSGDTKVGISRVSLNVGLPNALPCSMGGLCMLGDRGPGGGIVFYDAGSAQSWGRYLEAAPNTWNGGTSDPTLVYQSTYGCPCAYDTAIGAGRTNTAAYAGSAFPAAEAVRAYSVVQGSTTYNDWFIPSTDELNEMYKQASLVGGFGLGFYWSSSTYNTGAENAQNFQSGTIMSNIKSGSGYTNAYGATIGYTRPVRAFNAGDSNCAQGAPCSAIVTGGSSCERGISCSIGDTGPGGGKIFFVDTNDDVVGIDYMEIAPTDASANWCNTAAASSAISGATDNSSGINNMQGILGACTSGAGVSARATTIGGKSDWYLPAPAELALARTNLVQAGLDSSLTGDYWTSRQYDATRAYTYDPATGMQVYAGKSDTRAYRPIRAFAARSATPVNASLTGFAVPASSYAFGTAPFPTTAPTSLNPGLTVYSSSNTAVATINPYSGQVTIVGAGSVTFTATKAAYGSFVAKSQTASFTVTKGTPTLTNFAAPGGPYRADDADFTMNAPTVSTQDAGAVSYSSANTAIATINSTTGLVHLVAAGVVVLTASVPGSANWNAGSTTFTLNVGALCKDGGSCRIGDVGPGGGTVFLVDSNNEYPTVDFMEIAPADASGSSLWCPSTMTAPTTGTAIGTGAGNTTALLAANGACAAASVADTYSTSTQNDWHLPSRVEFQTAVTNLATKGITLPTGSYWTSSGTSNGPRVANALDNFVAGPTAQSSSNTWQYLEVPADRASATLLSDWQTAGNEVIGGQPQWDNNRTSSNYPFVQNISIAPSGSAMTGQSLLIHPDNSGYGVGVAWKNTTGSTITVDLSAGLKLAYPNSNADGIDYWVQRGLVGDTNYQLLGSGSISSGDTATTTTTAASVTLAAGEAIYVVVGRGSQNYYWDHTILDFNVTTSAPRAIAVDASGTASSVFTTDAQKVRAVRAWQRRGSCKEIKESTGTNANGVYTINIDNAGTIVPTQAYCLMDSAMGGGGWTLVLKAAQNSTTFPYSSSYWTTANTLNESSLNATSADAKFSTFNILQGTQVLAIFPDIDTSSFGATERGSIDGQSYGWTWRTTIPGGPKTALSIFQGSDEQFVSDALTFDGYNGTIWSSQSDIRFYGFNWNDNRKARWGFGWNENGGGLWPNGYKGSDDTSGGLGLADNSWSAGDILGCCQSTVGLRRSMAVQMFIR